LSISADPLSPQVGEYRFSQDLLRQVAYETLSRRDRKALHLAVAEHLRRVFPGDGDEMSDAVAHHYLDAMDAVPDATDVADIRAQAIAMLTRGGDRARRSGSAGAAATAYAKAADLTAVPDDEAALEGAADLYERASRAAQTAADYTTSVAYADQAATLYRGLGRVRDEARAKASAGVALLLAGRFTEAGVRLTPALEVLTPRPDADAVRALGSLAALEALAGGPDADRLSAEALELGQALEVSRSDLAELFSVRGLAHRVADRYEQAVASYYHAARLSESAGDFENRSRAFLNISDVLAASDPKAAAEAAREAIADARRFGARAYVEVASINLAAALLDTGDWDEAQRVLKEAELDSLDGSLTACLSAMVAALRGEVTEPAGLNDMHESEDPQNRAAAWTTQAHIAAARGDLQTVVLHAREVLDLVSVLGIRVEFVRWTWPLAVRAAYQLKDRAVEDEFLAVIDAHPVGHLAPVVRAERDLLIARRLADDGEDAGADFDAAIAALRRVGSPYNTAHGLLDQAAYLFRCGDTDQAAALVDEARVTAERLRADPLLVRAEQVNADALDRESGTAVER
jgi:tetratricopeptide (TPR) repeat protein